MQTGVLSPSKLRIKLIGSHHLKKKDGLSNSTSSRASPSKLQDSSDSVNNSLLISAVDDEQVVASNQLEISSSSSQGGHNKQVKTTTEDENNVECDSNASSSSFEFPNGERPPRPMQRQLSRSFSRPPASSKWNDAEKWVISRPAANHQTSKKMTTSVMHQNQMTSRFLMMRVSPESSGEDHKVPANVDSTATQSEDKSVPVIRAVTMKDMGTEMTPMASQVPSTTSTPIGATTPLCSPTVSIPSTPGRDPALGGATDNTKLAVVSEEEMKLKTRREIIALGVQLGKKNITAWASEQEKEHYATQVKMVSVSEFERRAAAFEQVERTKHEARFKREAVMIKMWESRQKAKLEAEMRRIEAKVEEMKCQCQTKMLQKIEKARHRSEEKRAKVEAKRDQQFPLVLEMVDMLNGNDAFTGPVGDIYHEPYHRKLEDSMYNSTQLVTQNQTEEVAEVRRDSLGEGTNGGNSLLIMGDIRQGNITAGAASVMDQMADEAWTLGLKSWVDINKFHSEDDDQSLPVVEGTSEPCSSWVSMSGDELANNNSILLLPCGLAAGSSITVIGTPQYAHPESVPRVGKLRIGDDTNMVSQFVVELQGLKSVDGEDPPKVFHLNPRLKGDWSQHPVIEHNACYRMQWGRAQRCDGLPSEKEGDMLVDGFVRCEKWMRSDIIDSRETKTTSWFKRFIGREQKPEVAWPYPFQEGRLFILTLRAGLEGYHVNVGGRHVSSFHYRPGFTLEDATGLAIKGNVDVHSVYATALPTTHRSFSPQRVLEMTEKWKAGQLPKGPIRMFIGILSATNHFAERMAIRKTWMQSSAIKSFDVVVRFFVALNTRKGVNKVLKKEAAYFGDIVILPFMDHYELVVLKTIAICAYGVVNTTASYVMKCDDDTFVRVDSVLNAIDQNASKNGSFYMGNMNLKHRPLRKGKWAVNFEEWPSAVYPPYANGPGYIISSDIAKYIVGQHRSRSLKLFKMEDVSMGMWVQQFNSSTPVKYYHSWKFCQYGCIPGYHSSHYQSPKQMMCLWDKLGKGHAQCCNFR
ncbi:unnamed protein product [Rhodiola kirilowii]